MSAEIVNLRRARKAKARAEDAAQAAVNRARFGERKAERSAREAEAERAAQVHAGHERGPNEK